MFVFSHNLVARSLWTASNHRSQLKISHAVHIFIAECPSRSS